MAEKFFSEDELREMEKRTVDRLVEAMSSVLRDDTMRERAAELGRRIRDEDGVARAIEQLEGLDRSPRGARGAVPSVPR